MKQKQRKKKIDFQLLDNSKKVVYTLKTLYTILKLNKNINHKFHSNLLLIKVAKIGYKSDNLSDIVWLACYMFAPLLVPFYFNESNYMITKQIPL